ncbi:hypothetical protein I5H19_gp066 [Mycobacterium phage Burwell21]|uniref:Uncharacterized protein n=1 Tax=Mycobacterium phage Burwell21 TaxID=2301702 RepID=A0A385DWQ9_9CAUD|nr:hypothetical protein I5H19_gp066 [Mycobacterium phage Burwell21]AXQ63052.1 hypothetical protein SEA_BURWELL21_66 [Mycobacterium phage Burwell21]
MTRHDRRVDVVVPCPSPFAPFRVGASTATRTNETSTHTGEPMSNLTPEQLEAIAYIVLAFTGPPSLAYFLVKGLFR